MDNNSIEGGRELSSPGSLAQITGMVDPGKQRVSVLRKQMSLVMKSPTVKVVREKRGQGDGDR